MSFLKSLETRSCWASVTRQAACSVREQDINLENVITRQHSMQSAVLHTPGRDANQHLGDIIGTPFRRLS